MKILNADLLENQQLTLDSASQIQAEREFLESYKAFFEMSEESDELKETGLKRLNEARTALILDHQYTLEGICELIDRSNQKN